MKNLILCFVFFMSSFVFAKTNFDKPSNTVVTNLPTDKLNPQAKRTVTCHTFPASIVKIVDYGEKGAERLSLLPPKTKTNCVEAVEPNEHIITNWAGYFFGVKGDYAFFHGDDATVRGGIPFLVYNLKLKRPLFADESIEGEFLSIKPSKKNIVLNFVRVFSADCSIAQALGQKCHRKILEKSGLNDTFLGACYQAYDEEADRNARFKCKGSADHHCVKNLRDKEYEMAATSPTILNYKAEAVVPADAAAWDPLDPKNYVKKKSEAMKCYLAQ